MKTAMQNVVGQAQFASPRGDRLGLALPFDEPARSTIAVLLLWRGPVAVIRAVTALVVAALDGVLRRRSRAHISQELREVVTPLIADRDAAPAVVGVTGDARVQATATQIGPALVLRRLTSAVNGPFSIRGRRDVGLEAAARARVAAGETGGSNDKFATAFTTATPAVAASGCSFRRHSGQANEHLAGKISGLLSVSSHLTSIGAIG